MLKPKKIPIRMCVACHEMKPKKELQRIVRSPEGEVSIDPVGKKPGRGAYLCASVECLRKARKQKALERKFESPVSDEVYAALEAQFAALPAQSDQK
jgi:predicted RNA-binding protein YlxR (DUF448 family)